MQTLSSRHTGPFTTRFPPVLPLRPPPWKTHSSHNRLSPSSGSPLLPRPSPGFSARLTPRAHSPPASCPVQGKPESSSGPSSETHTAPNLDVTHSWEQGGSLPVILSPVFRTRMVGADVPTSGQSPGRKTSTGGLQSACCPICAPLRSVCCGCGF